MSSSNIIINKVAESGIITIDLEEYTKNTPIKIFDLKNYLFMELILKEKDFRTALTQANWEEYKDMYWGVNCSADAIIPLWAYMLVASYVEPFAKKVFMGNEEQVKEQILLHHINSLDIANFTDKRIVIKGCGMQNIVINNRQYFRDIGIAVRSDEGFHMLKSCSNIVKV